jgi:acyl-coenzyme A thioesterase PaaI-like protein
MELDLDDANRLLAEIRDVKHPNCRLSGSDNPEGLRLKFRMVENGDVEADFDCASRFQGYSEIVHGGVLAACLDAAMVNSLFARRIDAVTAELVVRYHDPVRLGVPAVVRGRLAKATSRLYFLQSEIVQEGRVKAAGSAKFMAMPPAVDKATSPGVGSSHSG